MRHTHFCPEHSVLPHIAKEFAYNSFGRFTIQFSEDGFERVVILTHRQTDETESVHWTTIEADPNRAFSNSVNSSNVTTYDKNILICQTK